MELNDKVIREISAIVVLVLFGVLIFFAVKPLLFAIIWGLILGYVFMPVYRKLTSYVKNKTLSAFLIMLLAILVIMIPLWFLAPMMVQQVFELFQFSQTMDLQGMLNNIFPTSSSQFISQLSTALNTLVGKLASAVMNTMVDYFMNIPMMLVNLVVICFVFFFALRDSERLKEFVKSLSPLSKSKERIVVQQFKDITYSIIYGNFVVGIAQGLLAALGLFVFGVKNALVLSVLSMLLAILPMVGVFIIWIPVAIYMFASGNVAIAIAFVLYNLVIVSNADNLLRAYILSRKTNLSPVFALISSIGGLFLFGVIGLILGPLIFAYFIILVDLYREKNLLSLFSGEEPEKPKNPENK